MEEMAGRSRREIESFSQKEKDKFWEAAKYKIG
jgi:hypothetical protein